MHYQKKENESLIQGTNTKRYDIAKSKIVFCLVVPILIYTCLIFQRRISTQFNFYTTLFRFGVAQFKFLLYQCARSSFRGHSPLYCKVENGSNTLHGIRIYFTNLITTLWLKLIATFMPNTLILLVC